MTDLVDEMVVAVRADTGAFRREVAALRAEMEGPLALSADVAGRGIERALTRAVTTGKLGMEDLKRIMLSTMAELARAAMSNAFGGGQGGGAGGGGLLSLGVGVLGALFGAPGRATGGPVSAGRAYMVGERGPELFVPTAAGRIEPNGAAPRNISITVNVQGQAGNDPARMTQTGRQLARAVRRAVASDE